ncbi:hypothetical protein ACQ4PT_017416 [Festuca glaucescens]
MAPQQPAARHNTQNDEIATSTEEIRSDELMLDLSKYILLLATLVATVTYAAGFTPPGGVWQETDDAAGHVAGDSIIRTTNNGRYLVFYYCNATASPPLSWSSSLVHLLTLLHERKGNHMRSIKPLQAVMVLDLVSVMGAYAAGTCRDKTTTIYTLVPSGCLIGLPRRSDGADLVFGLSETASVLQVQQRH